MQFTLSISIVLVFVLCSAQDEDNYLITRANLTGPDNHTIILKETPFNFHRVIYHNSFKENLKDMHTVIAICIVKDENQMQECTKFKVSFLINNTDKTATTRMISKARNQYGHDISMFFGDPSFIDTAYIERPPVIYPLTNHISA